MSYELNSIEELIDHPFNTLSDKSRFSSLRLIVPNDDAQHTCRVGSLSILLVNQLNILLRDKLDPREVAYRALIHDYGESVSADLVCSVKHGNNKIAEGLAELEAENLSKVPCMTSELFKKISTAKSDGTFYSNILEVADKLDAFITINREYLIQQTKEFDTLFCECYEYTRKAFLIFSEKLKVKEEIDASIWLDSIIDSFSNYFNEVRLDRYLRRKIK